MPTVHEGEQGGIVPSKEPLPPRDPALALVELKEVLGRIAPKLEQLLRDYAAQTGHLQVNETCPFGTPGACSILCDALAFALIKDGYLVDLMKVTGLPPEVFGFSDHEILWVTIPRGEDYMIDPSYLQCLLRWDLPVAGQEPFAVFPMGSERDQAVLIAGQDRDVQGRLQKMWGNSAISESHEIFLDIKAALNGHLAPEVMQSRTVDQAIFHGLLARAGWI